MESLNLKINKIAYHRNGIHGNSFHVITFTNQEQYDKNNPHRMIAVLFNEPGNCAVFDLDLLNQGIIEFAQNSWRGDNFEPQLRTAIESN